jgi:excisionase family DNA binding protein
MAKLSDINNVMTIQELADYLKVSKSTLYKLCGERRVPGQKVGKHWRFNRNAIDQWLGSRTKVGGLKRL